MDNKKKPYLIVIALLLIIFTVAGTSFALFSFSRLGETSTTIQSGDIEFSFLEGNSVTLEDAFPISDEIGAVDTKNMYEFNVKMTASSNKISTLYDVSLLTDNTSTNHFNNNEIKYNLLKNNEFVVGTELTGELLTSIDGFNSDSSTGLGVVLENQEIESNEIDNYKLRIWIDESVNYSGEIDSAGTMTGTKNNYTYTLKVKVTSGTVNDTGTPNEGIGADPIVKDVEVAGKVATITLTDKVGIQAYAITETTETPGEDEWTYVNEDGTIKQMSTNKEVSVTYTAGHAGTFYAHIKDTSNRVSYSNFEISSAAFCQYKPGDVVQEFNYTGGVQTFITPCDGTYKLEVYGGQGQTATGNAYHASGGNGGYSYGNFTVLSTQNLYVTIGGGLGNTYNGGGYSSGEGGNGGGATHIATTNRGVLSNYDSYRSEVLIVAGGGGGGGASHLQDIAYKHNGGTGGGLSGGTQYDGGGSAAGGTQTTGYAFGYGSNQTSQYGGAGGGGGWYGGQAGGNYNGGCGGGGGSGYINTSLLLSGTTGTSNGLRSGNGYAKITILSINR